MKINLPSGAAEGTGALAAVVCNIKHRMHVALHKDDGHAMRRDCYTCTHLWKKKICFVAHLQTLKVETWTAVGTCEYDVIVNLVIRATYFSSYGPRRKIICRGMCACTSSGTPLLFLHTFNKSIVLKKETVTDHEGAPFSLPYFVAFRSRSRCAFCA